MDVIPIPTNIQRGAPFPPAMGQGFPQQMIPPGAFRPQYYPGPFVNPAEASQKAS